jgi:hypothetical protein
MKPQAWIVKQIGVQNKFICLRKEYHNFFNAQLHDKKIKKWLKCLKILQKMHK